MRHRNDHRRSTLAILAAAWLCMLISPAFAQAPPPAEAETVAPGEDAAAQEGAPEATEAEDDGKVAINLNNVDVDQVIKFLADITHKVVVKHKDVKAQITVLSPGEVEPRTAFALICDALLMEKVAVVEDEDTIKLMPVDLLSEVVIDLQPGVASEISAGIIRRVVNIRFASVSEIEKLVKPLLSKNGSVIADPSSKKVIITDTASRVTSIEEVIAQLDILDTDERQVKIFTLKHADAEELAPLLKSVLGILAQKDDAGGGQQQKGKPPQPQPQKKGQQPSPGQGLLDVVPYKIANWLVLVAPKELIGPAQSLVEELDRERPPELTLRVLPIQFADASEIAGQLKPIFQKRPEKRLEETVEITAHDRSSSLLVLSSQANFDLIKTVVAELDTEESVQVTTKTYQLAFADAEDISEQMNELYTGLEQEDGYRGYYYWSYRSRMQDTKTRFVPETRTNSVIAIARPTEFAKIDDMIEKLDTPIDSEQAAPKIFRVKYVDAQELTEVLNQIFGVEDSSSSGGYYDYWYGNYGSKDVEVGRLYGKVRFVPETATNAIIVTTNNKENFPVIEQFIRELDQFNPDAANTMVVPLQNAKAEELAEQLNTLFAREGARAPTQKEGEEQRSSFYAWLTGGQSKTEERAISNLIGQVRVVPDVRTNALTITTAVQNFELLREIIDKLDVESPKVLVRVRLIEVTTTKVSRIGTRFSSDESVFESDDFDNGLKSTFGLNWEEIHRDGTVAANIDIGLLVQFMQRHADTHILSEPTLVMNNNQTANIFVGSRIPFITKSQSTPEGTLNQSFEYKDAGTTLKITPNINTVDKVVMKVELESSQIRPGEVLFGGFIIDSRQFNTELAVESGETIVIGGIRRESDSEAVRRVPVLGHIPIVNLAFRKKDTKREATELIAFITPSVLRGGDSDREVTREAVDRLEVIQDWRNPLENITVDPKDGAAEELELSAEDSDTAQQRHKGKGRRR